MFVENPVINQSPPPNLILTHIFGWEQEVFCLRASPRKGPTCIAPGGEV